MGSKNVKGTSRTRRRKEIFIPRGNSHAMDLIIFNGIARVGWEKYRTHRQLVVWKNVLPLTFNNFQGKSTTWHSNRKRKTLSTTGFLLRQRLKRNRTWRPRKRCKTYDSRSMTLITWKLSFRQFVSIFIAVSFTFFKAVVDKFVSIIFKFWSCWHLWVDIMNIYCN